MRLESVKSNKVNNLLNNSWPLANIVFLLTAIVIAEAQAADCKILTLLSSKSQGVSVQNNLCVTDDKVSVGSNFILAAGGRLWLKALSQDNRDFQLICQNRMTNDVEVEFLNQSLPWVMPKDAYCNKWADNKLSCADKSGNKNKLICVIAETKTSDYMKVTQLKRTTSVKMRTVIKEDDNNLSGKISKHELIKMIISNIQSEVGICRKLNQVEQNVKASWSISTDGQVEKLLLGNNSNIDQYFLSCASRVIHDFSYPESIEKMVFDINL